MAAVIDDTCTNCKACENVCPTKSILPSDGKFVVDSDTCDDSGLCLKVCPVSAITIIKNKTNSGVKSA